MNSVMHFRNVSNMTGTKTEAVAKLGQTVCRTARLAVIAAVLLLSVSFAGCGKKTAAEEAFAAAADTYNRAVTEYDEWGSQMNSLIDDLQKMHLTDLPEPVALEEQLKENYQQYIETDPGLDALNTETGTITEGLESLKTKYQKLCVDAYNSVVDDYNVVANAYNDAVQKTSVDFVDNMPDTIAVRQKIENFEDVFEDQASDEVCRQIQKVLDETEEAAGDYMVLQQITDPSGEWILQRLQNVDGITEAEAVSEGNDPNGLLGKEGGYTACVYFSYDGVDSDDVPGEELIEKGTDAGGAIEVYDTLRHALSRCDYLSQFDGTLLYSGSYAIIGTMVIRTSYLLDDAQQYQLTSDITEAVTTVSEKAA